MQATTIFHRGEFKFSLPKLSLQASPLSKKQQGTEIQSHFGMQILEQHQPLFIDDKLIHKYEEKAIMYKERQRLM